MTLAGLPGSAYRQGSYVGFWHKAEVRVNGGIRGVSGPSFVTLYIVERLRAENGQNLGEKGGRAFWAGISRPMHRACHLTVSLKVPARMRRCHLEALSSAPGGPSRDRDQPQGNGDGREQEGRDEACHTRPTLSGPEHSAQGAHGARSYVIAEKVEC
jgi:hypothetical protein